MMKIKSIINWIVAISLLLTSWLWSAQWLMAQNAKQRCFKFEATTVEIVYFKAYCGAIYMGQSKLIPLAQLEDYYQTKK